MWGAGMTDSFIPSKDRYPVRVTMQNGVEMEGYLFVQSHERLIDVMNDDRMFLPFETKEDDFMILNKSGILQIVTRSERSASKLARPTVSQ